MEKEMAKTAKASAKADETLMEGKKAPDFTLKDDSGATVKLSALKGNKVVLYFYPKDDTPGCTKEACSFRDGFKEIQKKGAIVLGVSPDSVESHKKFKEKFHLNFQLLSDDQKKVVNAYGVWKQKSLYGRKYMGVERTTFVIDEEGRIKKTFPKVKVDGHYEEVLAEL
jgi:peroxiredoxin Q/BCP